MADVEVVEFFQARCYECGWSGDEAGSWREAEEESDAHVCSGGVS